MKLYYAVDNTFLELFVYYVVGLNIETGGNLNGMEIVFCYQNCSDLPWEKIVLVIKKNFKMRGWRPMRWLEQFVQTVKGQNNFW